MGKSKASKTKVKQKCQETTLRKSPSRKGFGAMSPFLDKEDETPLGLMMKLEDYGKYHLDMLTNSDKYSRRIIVTLQKYFLHAHEGGNGGYILGREKDSAYAILFVLTMEQLMEIVLLHHKTYELELLPEGCIEIPISGNLEGGTKPYIPYKLVNFLVCTGLDS